MSIDPSEILGRNIPDQHIGHTEHDIARYRYRPEIRKGVFQRFRPFGRASLRAADGMRLLTKEQLASELGRSTRWVELRMKEGLPVLPRRLPGEHARFELAAVREWLDQRAEQRRRGNKWTVKVYDPSPGASSAGSARSTARPRPSTRSALRRSASLRPHGPGPFVTGPWSGSATTHAPHPRHSARTATRSSASSRTPATSCSPASIGPRLVDWLRNGRTTPHASRARCSATRSATD